MIKLIKSTFLDEKNTKKALCDFIMEADTLSIGKECRLFEHNFAAWQQSKHCIFLNSGSSANLAVIQALLNLGRIKKGDNIGFSALTWSTNVMPLIQLGLNPIPVDCELDTLNVSSRTLIAVLKKTNIKMLFLTNLLGFCDDLDEIVRICKEKKILLVEDNCESLGTVYKGKKLGNFGLASTFSFYVGHHMSTIEGGAICTNDTELETMIQLVRAHGWDRNLTEDKQLSIRTKHHVNETFYSRYTFYDLGYNLRTMEIQGFIGNTQIKHLPFIIEKRQKNFMVLAKEIFKRTDLYYPMRYSHIDTISNFAVPIICRSQKIRDELVKKCDGKVEIRPIVGGDMTKQPFYGKYIHSQQSSSTLNANIAHEQGLYFGNNPELTKKDLQILLSIFS